MSLGQKRRNFRVVDKEPVVVRIVSLKSCQTFYTGAIRDFSDFTPEDKTVN